jgi:GNAT superfamily N-acetyltransferase
MDMSFGRIGATAGQRIIYDRLSISQANTLAVRLNLPNRGMVPGFVWEEDGKIVGNVTLLSSEIRGRYLIANVAVHPDYRRQGIARGLMNKALDHIKSLAGDTVLLQVESNNEVALSLYESLSFHKLGNMHQWQATGARIRAIPGDSDLRDRVRPLDKHDFRAAFNLDCHSVHPDLNWPNPPPPDFYESGLLRRMIDFLNGRRHAVWVVDTTSGLKQKRYLTGLVSISSEWGRPTWLRVRIDPHWQGQYERSLLSTAISRLKHTRSSNIRSNHPAGDELVSQLLSEANFNIRRTLAVMKLELSTKR